MVPETSLLVLLVPLVDRLPTPPSPQRGCGRPPSSADRLFLQALVLMILKHRPTPDELLTVLAPPTAAMTAWRALLTEQGRDPPRRTGERRLAALPARLPAPIRCLGCQLVDRLPPWATGGRAVAADRTGLHAHGGVWPKKTPRRGGSAAPRD